MAHTYGRATSSSCQLCHLPDSLTHMLSGCQNFSIQNKVTERHNIAGSSSKPQAKVILEEI